LLSPSIATGIGPITGRRIFAQLGLYIQWRNREGTKKNRN